MPENVDLFHRLNAAVNRADVEYAIRHSTDDVLIIAARSAVEGTFVGHDGMRKFFADNAMNFEVFGIAATTCGISVKIASSRLAPFTSEAGGLGLRRTSRWRASQPTGREAAQVGGFP